MITTIALLLFFLVDGVVEGVHWKRNEPLHPDLFHPAIGLRNLMAVLAGCLGGLTILNALGICLVGGLVLREGALNSITRGVPFPETKQSLLGIPRHPILEAPIALGVGIVLILV